MTEIIKTPRQERIEADLQRIKILQTELEEIRERENYIKSEILFLSNRIKEAESKAKMRDK